MADVNGSYDLTVKSPMGDQRSVLTVTADGAGFTGTNNGSNGDASIDGSVDGATLVWQQQLTSPFPMTLEFAVTVEGDAVSGNVKTGMFGTFPITGQRQG